MKASQLRLAEVERNVEKPQCMEQAILWRIEGFEWHMNHSQMLTHEAAKEEESANQIEISRNTIEKALDKLADKVDSIKNEIGRGRPAEALSEERERDTAEVLCDERSRDTAATAQLARLALSEAQRLRLPQPEEETGPRARARSCPSAPRGEVQHPPNPRDGGRLPARGSPRWSGLGREHPQTLNALPEKRACLEA